MLFYDRTSGAPDRFDLTLATGLPSSFTSTRVTTQSSHFDKNLWFPVRGVRGCERCAGFIGDYVGLAYGPDGVANTVWTDLRRRVTVQRMGDGYTESVFCGRS